jgi:hypothetical protein
MPKILFYGGTAFCLFLALTSAAEALRYADGGTISFAALSFPAAAATRAAWAIVVAFVAGLASAAIFLRMAALLAARNLFGALLATLSVSGAVVSLAWLLLLQSRMLLRGDATTVLGEMHFAALMMLGYFVSLSLFALRPYFRIQASRVLGALVFFPLPLFTLMLAQELFAAASIAPLPASSPASFVFFLVLAVLFFSIAVHCIRHRHLFIEPTNLRELLDGRVDPAARPSGRPLRLNGGGVAFDS